MYMCNFAMHSFQVYKQVNELEPREENTHHPENKNKFIPLAQANCTTKTLDDTKLTDTETLENVQLVDSTRETLAKSKIVILPDVDWIDCNTNELYGLGNEDRPKMPSYPSLTDDSAGILTEIEESVKIMSKQLLIATSAVEKHTMLRTSNERLVKLMNLLNTLNIPQNMYEHTQKRRTLTSGQNLYCFPQNGLIRILKKVKTG